jgi:shikimate kinase
MKNNITLIGMAGVGKSYIGERLAIKISYEYIKVDDLITLAAEKIGVKKHLLPDEKFMELEEKAVLSLEGKKNSIFDTGGSVIYSNSAMKWLKENSFIIYLKDKPENIKKRFDERGEPHLIGIEGKSFKELLAERIRLYENYADLNIDVSKSNNLEEAVVEIIENIN